MPCSATAWLCTAALRQSIETLRASHSRAQGCKGIADTLGPRPASQRQRTAQRRREHWQGSAWMSLGYAQGGQAQATSCPETRWQSCAQAWVRDEEPRDGRGNEWRRLGQATRWHCLATHRQGEAGQGLCGGGRGHGGDAQRNGLGEQRQGSGRLRRGSETTPRLRRAMHGAAQPWLRLATQRLSSYQLRRGTTDRKTEGTDR